MPRHSMPELRCRLFRVALAVVMLSLGGLAPAATTFIGSKAFTESVILGELATQLTEEAGFDAEHRRQLGGTRVLWSALIRGDIQCYPEYTGTLRTEIFSSENISDDGELRRALTRQKIWTSTPLGFNN